MSNSSAFVRSAPQNFIDDPATQVNSAVRSSFKLRFGIAFFLIIQALFAFTRSPFWGPPSDGPRRCTILPRSSWQRSPQLPQRSPWATVFTCFIRSPSFR